MSGEGGYFRFGRDLVCYGQSSSINPTPSVDDELPDLLEMVRTDQSELTLPFDLNQLVENLTHERYLNSHGALLDSVPNRFLSKLYYSLRPFLSAFLRVPLQRMYFRGWEEITFPSWPVDVTVEKLLERVLWLCLKSSATDRIPFIWFWPDGAPSAAILTHDVETPQGRDFCPFLMDIDESFGFRSAFEIVPEERYLVTESFLDEIRVRGHEIDVQDLNHDGMLFRDQSQFLSRVKRINEYGRSWGAKGFRSAILYRNLDWYSGLNFEYDMSVPNVGHLEPQRGGGCTVFPYFIGNVLELPVTTTQDWSLFRILRHQDIDLWKTQAALVMEKHGLISFITHPDYLLESRPQNIYRDLLTFIAQLESEQKIWVALPHQVNDWWRQRSRMTLIPHGNAWRIDGVGNERARLAYARIDGKRLVYTHAASAQVV